MKKPQKQISPEQRKIGFGSLVLEALPEMWGFQTLVSILLGVPTWLLNQLIYSVAASTGGAITTANLGRPLLSWRAPVLLALGVVLVLCFVVAELFAQIYLTDDILAGRPAGIRRELGLGVRSVRRFLSPTGVAVLLFIFLAVPLCGIGFSISLTSEFKIPNFIMDVVYARPYYAVPYFALLLLFAYMAYRYCFTLHAVLLDGMTCARGRKVSALIMKEHGKTFVLGLFRLVLTLSLIKLAGSLLFSALPGFLVERFGAELPHDLVIDAVGKLETGLTEPEKRVVVYRVLAAFTVLLGGYLNAVVTLLCGAYFVLRFTRYYREYSGETAELWPERPKKARYRRAVLAMALFTGFVAAFSVVVGVGYNELLVREEPVRIIAHRAGGTMASENSIEGLYAAIEHGCYGSETDIRRTKDGYYVINHDNDFKRLTGVAKAPKDMTLDEIRQLRVRDTTGSGAELSVPTLEEMLDVVKDREKLFIEFKGATADRQMADDVAALCREKDCVDDVVLISLAYKVIDYAETAYPEFETGVLFFAGLGDVSRLNCDLLIMEEEMGTPERIRQIHNAGKQAIVWTVNTEQSMNRFLQSDCDAIITDEIELAETVQAKLDARTEYEVLEDTLADFWT